jgi:hypothetical protein
VHKDSYGFSSILLKPEILVMKPEILVIGIKIKPTDAFMYKNKISFSPFDLLYGSGRFDRFPCHSDTHFRNLGSVYRVKPAPLIQKIN